jgi:hypothetical protein
MDDCHRRHYPWWACGHCHSHCPQPATISFLPGHQLGVSRHFFHADTLLRLTALDTGIAVGILLAGRCLSSREGGRVKPDLRNEKVTNLAKVINVPKQLTFPPDRRFSGEPSLDSASNAQAAHSCTWEHARSLASTCTKLHQLAGKKIARIHRFGANP